MNWKDQLDLNRITRQRFTDLLNGYESRHIAQCPPGYRNHLLWNFGHVIVTRQSLVYKLSGLKTGLSSDMLSTYSKGSLAKNMSAEEAEVEYNILRSLSDHLLDQFEVDIEGKLFKEFTPYTTSYGIALNSLEEAIAFNNLHESLHLGYAMAMRQHINK